MTTTHRPLWRVRKAGTKWHVGRRTGLTAYPRGQHWIVWAIHGTHASALAHALAEAHRHARS